MKNLFVFFSLIVFAQGITAQTLSDQFYIRFGYAHPSWNHFDLGDEHWPAEFDRYGANFEIGNIYLIKSILKSNVVAFGINADFFYTNYTHFQNKAYTKTANLAIFRVGSKLGPSFTVSPMNNMGIDVYAKLDMAWATGALPYIGAIGDIEDYYIDYVSPGFSTGLNFRYGLLIIGVEFNTVSPKLESDDFPGTYLQEVVEVFLGGDNYRDGSELSGNEKSKLPSTIFKIGFTW